MGKQRKRSAQPAAAAAAASKTAAAQKPAKLPGQGVAFESLAARDQGAVRKVEQLIEKKQLKKAMKTLDELLRRLPGLAEANSSRATILWAQDRKDEALEQAKDAIKYNMRSARCWSVYGRMLRDAKRFDEAARALSMGLMNKADDWGIISDLSQVQIHLRDYRGFMESRRRLLALRSGFVSSWVGFLVGAALCREWRLFDSVCDIYWEQQQTAMAGQAYVYAKPSKRTEIAQYSLFRARMMLDHQPDRWDDIEQELTRHSSVAAEVDVPAVGAIRAELAEKQGRLGDAAEHYLALIGHNPNCLEYHSGLQRCHRVDPDAMLALYEQLEAAHPRSAVVREQRLVFLPASHGEWSKALRQKVDKALVKGVPSLHASLQALYADADKSVAIDALVGELWAGASDAATGATGDMQATAPSYVLWVMLLRAEHQLFTNKAADALQTIDQAIEHTPTLVEALLVKARVLTALGNTRAAAEWAERARQMDRADRYLNNEAVRFALRSNNVEGAIATLNEFTDGVREDLPVHNVWEMQALWFERELGEAYMRTGRTAAGLRALLSAHFHLQQMYDHQIEYYYTVGLRYVTLNSLMDAMTTLDNVWGTEHARRCLIGIVRAYLRLAAAGGVSATASGAATSGGKGKGMGKGTSSQQQQKAGGGSASDVVKPETSKWFLEHDLDGVEMLGGKTADALLGEALPFAKKLEEHNSESVEALCVLAELYIERGRYLLALRCLRRAVVLDTNESFAASALVARLFHQVDKADGDSPLSAVARKLLAEDRTRSNGLLGSASSAEEFARGVASRASTLQQRLEAARALVATELASKSSCEPLVELLTQWEQKEPLDVVTAEAVVGFATEHGSEALVEQLQGLGRKHFPQSVAFSASAEAASESARTHSEIFAAADEN